MKRLMYIERLVIAVLLLLLLALAPAMAQTYVHTGETTTLSVSQNLSDTYEWQLYSDSTVNFALVPGDNLPDYAEFVGGNTGTAVNVLWKKPGIYFYKATAQNGCTNNLKIGRIVIKLGVKAEFIPPDTTGVCLDKPVVLDVKLTGTPPWSFTYTDGTSQWQVTGVMSSLYTLTINPAPPTTTQYWIIKASDIYGTNLEPSKKITQKILPLPAPSNIYHR